MNEDQAIQQVERLYEAITGRPAALDQRTTQPIYSEHEIGAVVNQRIDQLVQALQNSGITPVIPSWNPAVSIWENQQEILVRMDLAGVKKENVDISIHENVLTVCGNRPHFDKEGDYQKRALEAHEGPFQRSLILPLVGPAEELDSKIIDGILEISISKETKKRSTKPKTVQ